MYIEKDVADNINNETIILHNNFNGKFKLEPVKTYHLGFVVKVLQKCYDIELLKNCPNKQISLEAQIK